jgi:hypothetical protein
MERSPPKPGRASGSPADQRATERQARLAAALRTNLRRRKAQSHARQDAGGDTSAANRPADTDERGNA